MQLPECAQHRINLNSRLKRKGASREDRKTLKEMRDAKKEEVNAKRTELDNFSTRLAVSKKELKEYKAAEVQAMKNNESDDEHAVMNHIETHMIKMQNL